MTDASGNRALRRLAVVHALNNAGEACFAISLAGSLFFGVSVDAARPLILLYLLVTMAPFAVVLPLLGPVIDRVRGGQRGVIITSMVGRMAVLALLTIHLERLAFYPEAFAALVLGKTYVISKAAIVPRVERNPVALVRANSVLSMVGAIGGASGGVAAVALMALTDATWVLRLGAVIFVVAAAVASSLPATRFAAAVGVIEVSKLRSPEIRTAAVAVGSLRLGVGFMVFHLAFTLKRSGEPLWVFGLVLAAGAIGSFAGSSSASSLRRRVGEDRIIATGLAIPVVVSATGALRFHRVSAVAVAAAFGVAGALARHGFDSLVQRQAPDVDRGRAFSRFETGFQLAWVIGALLPVAARPSDWVGMVAITAILTYTAAAYLREIRILGRARAAAAAGGLVGGLLQTAEASLLAGAGRQAIVVAAAAAEITLRTSNPVRQPADLPELLRLRDGAVKEPTEPPPSRAERALELARRVIADTQTGQPSG